AVLRRREDAGDMRAMAEVIGCRAGPVIDVVVARSHVDGYSAAGRRLVRVDAGVRDGDLYADAGAGGGAGRIAGEPAIVAVVVKARRPDPGEPRLSVVFRGLKIGGAGVGEGAWRAGCAARRRAGRAAGVAAAAPAAGERRHGGDAGGNERCGREVGARP